MKLKTLSKDISLFILSAFKYLYHFFQSDEQKVNRCLKTHNFEPFVYPHQHPIPTVEAHTRIQLERLREINIISNSLGIGAKAKEAIIEVFQTLVLTKKYLSTFPMTKLHGFSSSKSDLYRFKERVTKTNMADMGAIIHDLRDLENKSDEQIISACFNWRELRLEEGIKLITDGWHNRFYWCNKGGSHHMAVLCYKLRQLNRSWEPEVTIIEHQLNLSALFELYNKVAIFVVMKNDKSSHFAFNCLTEHLKHSVDFKLGVTTQSFSDSGISSLYELVFVDLEKQYSHVVNNYLLEQIKLKRALTLENFINDCVDHGSPHDNLWDKTTGNIY